uniref:IS66 family transposase n=1 Tax=Bacillus cereus TaxID=1396 RepID=UPI0020410720|nr:IS66 family transposase [Bacillus cereus]
MKTTLSHSNQPTIEALQAQVEELTAKVRWYEEHRVLSKSTLGKALTYCLNQ